MAFQIISFELGEPVFIIPQESIILNGKRYVTDFLFDTDEEECISQFYEYNRPFKIAIECDGYEFHNSTKKQVARDNSRNLDLKMAGYDVIHFSGSEIYRNPWECALKAIEYIMKNAKAVKADAKPDH